MAGQPTTRLHVSGHRFLLRRMTHALVRGDVRMLDDPLRAQALSLLAGAVAAAVAVAVCAVLALLRPATGLADAPVVMVRDSGAMYVRVGETIHAVDNLASARLIAGTPAAPRLVSQRAVDAAPHGPRMGIPDAPQDIPPPLVPQEADWTVCEDTGDDERAGTTVIAGPIAEALVAAGQQVLVSPRGGSAAATYLLYDGLRARVDLRHPAVVRALRIDGVVAQPVSPSLLAAIPEAPAIVPPHIPALGSPPPTALTGHPVGSVVAVPRTGGADHFVVLAGGVQRIGEVTADLIRYTDSRDGEQIPTVAPEVIGAVPVVDTLPVTSHPARGGVTRPAVICARWRVDGDGPGSHTAVLVGDSAPTRTRTVALAQADGPGPAVDAVAVPPGRSVYTRSVGLTGDGHEAGSLVLVTESGVRYGITDRDAAASLGLPADPVPAPWPVLAELPRGPELSRAAASVLRDGAGPAP